MTAPTKLSTRKFRGVIWDVVDGDTIDVLIDLDVFDQWLMRRFRLFGCNAAERNTPGGAAAKENLAGLLARGTLVTVTSVKIDKYGGRYDASITLPDGTDLVALLIAQQWVAAWTGAGVKPVPPWPRKVP